MKTINKCSHLKVVSPHFLSKSKRKPAKEVCLSKIAAVKITTCNFNKKASSQVPFTVTFFCIFQHTDVVVVNVKHKFHLDSRWFIHVTKGRILKNLNLRKKANRNFRCPFLKNRFKHLKLYSNPASWLARGRYYMDTF